MKAIPIPIFSDHEGAASGDWKSVDVAMVNSNTVRCRVMEGVAAPWHVHPESDEMFYVLSGLFHLDTEDGTAEVRVGELLVVPAGTRHRGRADVRTTLLVIDRIK
jgi:mannose-6-phosphate isomerase-like protein (cupin superfamily)